MVAIKERILRSIEKEVGFTTKGKLFKIDTHLFMGRELTLAQEIGRILLISIVVIGLLTGLGAMILLPLGMHKRICKWSIEMSYGCSILGKMHVKPVHVEFLIAKKGKKRISLPLDMELEIYKHCETKDLIALSRTSSSFYNSYHLQHEINKKEQNNRSPYFLATYFDRCLRMGAGLQQLFLDGETFRRINEFNGNSDLPTSFNGLALLFSRAQLYIKCPHLHTLELKNFNLNWLDADQKSPKQKAEYLRALVPASVKHLGLFFNGDNNYLYGLRSLISLRVKGNLSSDVFEILPRSLKKLEFSGHIDINHIAKLPPQLEQLALSNIPPGSDFSHLKKLKGEVKKLA